LGLASQSNAITVNTIPLNTVEVDKLNKLIADNQALIIIPSGDTMLTPQEQIANNIINNNINGYIQDKNNLLSGFMKELNDYLNLL
jgi:nickel-dependent lactate racemase